MTELDKLTTEKKSNNGGIFETVFLLAVTAIFLAIGLANGTESGISASILSPFQGTGAELITSAAVTCAADFVMILLISVLSHPFLSMLISSVVMAVRASALGITAAFCAVNSVPAISVALIISYALSTLLILIYAVFINKLHECRGFTTRLVFYLLVTGAVALLRLLPMLLL